MYIMYILAKNLKKNYLFYFFRKSEIQMGRTYMRVYAIVFGVLIGFTTYIYTIQDMKAKMQTEQVQLEYIGKKHALKKYDQFALNQILPSCAISRNFC